MIKQVLGVLGIAPPKPPDFFTFSVARAAGQGWLWSRLGAGVNPTAAFWEAKRAGILWDRSEFYKDAYRMSKTQKAMRETRDLPRDKPIPQSSKVETVFNVPDESQRARIKFYGRDERGRFAVRYREVYYSGDPTPSELADLARERYGKGKYPHELGLGNIFSTTVDVVFYRVN